MAVSHPARVGCVLATHRSLAATAREITRPTATNGRAVRGLRGGRGAGCVRATHPAAFPNRRVTSRALRRLAASFGNRTARRGTRRASSCDSRGHRCRAGLGRHRRGAARDAPVARAPVRPGAPACRAIVDPDAVATGPSTPRVRRSGTPRHSPLHLPVEDATQLPRRQGRYPLTPSAIRRIRPPRRGRSSAGRARRSQ